MEPLAKLLVSLMELAETELAMLKKSVIRLGLSLVMLTGAGILGVIGLCWVLNAVFLWLEQLTNRPIAFAICGVLFLVAAATMAILALKSKKTAKVATPPVVPEHAPVEGKTDDNAASMRIAS